MRAIAGADNSDAMDFAVHPTPIGAIFAALAVAGGAPLFSDGLRTLRLRRALAHLKRRPIRELPTGVVHVEGRVILDSPLFAPLSGAPCAGFRLEVRAGGGPIVTVEEQRPFRIGGIDATARVVPRAGEWLLPATGERDVAPNDSLSANLEALLQSSPEARWVRRTGVHLTLVERALTAGSMCHVVGHARPARAGDMVAELELRRTGTDDAVAVYPTVFTTPSQEPKLWIDDGGHLGLLAISDREPELRDLTASRIRTVGLLLGPLLSLGGLLYLANAAEYLRSLGRP
jgi:hypothetical protein